MKNSVDQTPREIARRNFSFLYQQYWLKPAE